MRLDVTEHTTNKHIGISGCITETPLFNKQQRHILQNKSNDKNYYNFFFFCR